MNGSQTRMRVCLFVSSILFRTKIDIQLHRLVTVYMSNTTTNVAPNDEAVSRVQPWCVIFMLSLLMHMFKADFDSKPILVHRSSWRLLQEEPWLSSWILCQADMIDNFKAKIQDKEEWVVSVIYIQVLITLSLITVSLLTSKI